MTFYLLCFGGVVVGVWLVQPVLSFNFSVFFSPSFLSTNLIKALSTPLHLPLPRMSTCTDARDPPNLPLPLVLLLWMLALLVCVFGIHLSTIDDQSLTVHATHSHHIIPEGPPAHRTGSRDVIPSKSHPLHSDGSSASAAIVTFTTTTTSSVTATTLTHTHTHTSAITSQATSHTSQS